MKKNVALAIFAAAMVALFASPVYAASKKKSKTAAQNLEMNRGKGLRITVPEPTTRGLTEKDDWVSVAIQEMMTAGLRNYTDMTVIDRSNEALILEEQKRSERGTYSDSDYLEMGKSTQAQYILAGSITNMNGVYRLTLNVNDGTTNEIKASYSDNAALNDIQNGNSTNAALAKLIPQMGFALTADEQTALNTKSQGAKSNDVQTQSAVNLAKGLSAEKNQNTVEALAYYASSMSAEAAVRYDKISIAVETGNIREDVKNDIAARNEWVKMYEQLQTYLNGNSIKVSYDVRPGDTDTNYRDNTVTIPFTYSYEVNQTALEVYTQVARGLNATGKKDKWDTRRGEFDISAPTYVITFELKNDAGERLGTKDVALEDGIVSAAIRQANRDLQNEARQKAEAEKQASGQNKFRFTHSNPSSSSWNSDEDDGVKRHLVKFSGIPYTKVSDSLSFGIAKIEVYNGYYYSRNEPLMTNPPIDVTVLGVEQAAQKTAAKGGAHVIEATDEPAAYGK